MPTTVTTYTQRAPRSDKESAIRALIAYVDDPLRIRRERMRRTKLPHVNEFADHEHMSMRTHCARAMCKDVFVYYGTMKKHLEYLTNIMIRDRGGHMNLANTIPLNAMFVGHSDQLVTNEAHRRVRCDFLRNRGTTSS